MTGTPRAPWTPEEDKDLRALVLSANSVDTYCQGSKPDHFFGTPPGKHTEELCALRRIKKFVQSLMSLEALAPVFSSSSCVSPQSASCSENYAIRYEASGRTITFEDGSLIT